MFIAGKETTLPVAIDDVGVTATEPEATTTAFPEEEPRAAANRCEAPHGEGRLDRILTVLDSMTDIAEFHKV
jgi:hypothetical protein